ncbi:hypothetical protein QYE76_043494 [Lolium multiflorum]|uniref:Uncharacterized protein n=1 Tax=Lolium multiflorum TaxID=4521 RepID=A0AAD8TJ85_LOLMU|nr:hypothetical protein QYE76_043494 [Lolium multiflorum]
MIDLMRTSLAVQRLVASSGLPLMTQDDEAAYGNLKQSPAPPHLSANLCISRLPCSSPTSCSRPSPICVYLNPPRRRPRHHTCVCAAACNLISALQLYEVPVQTGMYRGRLATNEPIEGKLETGELRLRGGWAQPGATSRCWLRRRSGGSRRRSLEDPEVLGPDGGEGGAD